MDNILLTDEEVKDIMGRNSYHTIGIQGKLVAQAQHNKTYAIAKLEGFEIGLEQGKAEGKRELFDAIMEQINKSPALKKEVGKE